MKTISRLFFACAFFLIFLFQSDTLHAQGMFPANGTDASRPNLVMTNSSGGYNSPIPEISHGSLKNFVNMHTGALVYEVPLFSVNSYKHSIPVSLSYQSSGAQIDQESHPIGLGWTMQAGGYIARKLKGIADDAEKGFLTTAIQVANYMNLTGDDKKRYIHELVGYYREKVSDDCMADVSFRDKYIDKQDSEPDIFQFTFPEGNGYFTFGTDGNIILFPQQNFEIKYYRAASGSIYGFEIQTNSGTKYTFGGVSSKSVEKTKMTSLSIPIKNNDIYGELGIWIRNPYSNGFCDYSQYKSIEEECYSGWSTDTKEYFAWDGPREWYKGPGEPEIDVNNLKEREEEWYNSKWNLTSIEYPDGDKVRFLYDRSNEKVYPQRPVVSSAEFDKAHYANDFQGPRYAYTENDEIGGETHKIAVFPENVVYDYNYFSHNFDKINTTTNQPFYQIKKPGFTTFPLYSSPSVNYSFSLRYVQHPYLIQIQTSTDSATFKYTLDGTRNIILNRISHYRSGNKIAEYALDNAKVKSNLYSEYADTYNLIEALLAKDLNINSGDYKYARSLINYDLSGDNGLIEKYVEPGYQEEVYERLFLYGVTLIGQSENRRLFSFTYNQPHLLPRRTSLAKDKLGYPVVDESTIEGIPGSTTISNSLIREVKTTSEQTFYVLDPFKVRSQKSRSNVGVLNLIKLETGGYITFNFGNNPGRLNTVRYATKPGAQPIEITMNYISRVFNESTKRFEDDVHDSHYYTFDQKFEFSHLYKFPINDWDYYNTRMIRRSTETVNDVNWFNTALINYSECWIDYNGIGKEVYKYTTPNDMPIVDYANLVDFVDPHRFYDNYDPATDAFGVNERVSHKRDYDGFPFSNIKSLHYLTGKIKEQYILDNNENLISRKVYNYDFSSTISSIKSTLGIHGDKLDLGLWSGHCKCGWICWTPVLKPLDYSYYAARYEHKSVFPTIESTIFHSFEPTSNTYIESLSSYELDGNHLQMKTVTGPGKDKNTQIVKLALYPEDFSNTTGFIGKMKELNMLSLPVEVVTYQVNSTSGSIDILSAQLTEYNATDPTKIENQYHLELRKPLALGSFKFSNAATGVIPTSGSIGTYSKYSGYVKNVEEFEYDGFNRVYTSKGKDGVWNSTLFNRNLNIPDAKIINQKIELDEIPVVDTKNITKNASEENNLTAEITIETPQTIKISTSFSSSENTPVLKIIVNSINFGFQREFYTSDYSTTVDLAPGKYKITFNSQPDGYYSKSLTMEYTKAGYDAFFTSFEEDGEESLEARSGKKVYNGSIFTFERPISSPSDYVISYWYLNGGTWHFSGNLPFAQTINLSYPIDDLRMHHKKARMTSYVYDEKGRMVSDLDERGINKKIEYDEFDRLIIERDHEENITKKVEYFLLGNNN